MVTAMTMTLFDTQMTLSEENGEEILESPDDLSRPQFSEIDNHAIPPLTINSLSGSPL